MIFQPVSSIFPVLQCPLGLGELQACPFPDVVFPPLLLSALSSFPFHCALQDGFGQTWWTGNMTIPLQFASFYDRQETFMWSYCLLDLGAAFIELQKFPKLFFFFSKLAVSFWFKKKKKFWRIHSLVLVCIELLSVVKYLYGKQVIGAIEASLFETVIKFQVFLKPCRQKAECWDHGNQELLPVK